MSHGIFILTGSLTLDNGASRLLQRNTQEALKTVVLTASETGAVVGLGAGKWYHNQNNSSNCFVSNTGIVTR